MTEEVAWGSGLKATAVGKRHCPPPKRQALQGAPCGEEPRERPPACQRGLRLPRAARSTGARPVTTDVYRVLRDTEGQAPAAHQLERDAKWHNQSLNLSGALSLWS